MSITSTRAKFKLNVKEENSYGSSGIDSIKVQLNAVMTDGEEESENTKFWEASPNGTLELTVDNKNVFPLFNTGQEFYIDITPIEPAEN